MEKTSDEEAARQAMKRLLETIARRTVATCEQLGIEFDMADPRVARWVLLATFESFFAPASRRPNNILLKLADEESSGEARSDVKLSGKRLRRRTLVTWEMLATSSYGDGEPGAA